MNCTDYVVQRFHPHLLAGMRVLTTSSAQLVSDAPEDDPEMSFGRRRAVAIRAKANRESRSASSPLLHSSTKSTTTAASAATLVPSIIIGVADGYLWRFEDGATGVTSFAATTSSHLDRNYQLVIPLSGKKQQPKRSTVRNVAAVLISEDTFELPPLPPQDNTDDNTAAPSHSSTKADLKSAAAMSNAGGGAAAQSSPLVQPPAVQYDFPVFHASAKRQRTWFPTRTGNSWFDYSHDEDADSDVYSFLVRQKSDLKSTMFGHKKEPFLFYAPISGREASRGPDARPLFPMLCEYDVSAASLLPFKVKRGDAVMVHKGNRAGRVMFIVGTLHGRLVLFEEGAFPIECDPSFTYASLQATPLEGAGGDMFRRELQSLEFAFPLRIAQEEDDGDTADGLSKQRKGGVDKKGGKSKNAATLHNKSQRGAASSTKTTTVTNNSNDADTPHDPFPPTLTCCGHQFQCSASQLFYQFGWFPLCRVGHRRGPRKGTTGVILGVETQPTAMSYQLMSPRLGRSSLRSGAGAGGASSLAPEPTPALWEYNESEGACFPLEGCDKHAVDQNHMLELIGFRSAPALVSALLLTASLRKKQQPSGNSRTSSSTTSATNYFSKVSEGSEAPQPPPPFPALLEPQFARFLCDPASLKAIDGATPIFPWRCCWSSVMSGGAGAPNQAHPSLELDKPAFGRTFSTAANDSPFGSMINFPSTILASTPRKGGVSQRQQRRGATHDGSLLPFDTRWSSLLPHGLGVHGSAVQMTSGVQYGRIGIFLGVHNNEAYVLWDHEVGAVRVTPSLRQRIRWLPHIAPRPVMFGVHLLPLLPPPPSTTGNEGGGGDRATHASSSGSGGPVTTCMSRWNVVKPAINGMLVSVDTSWQATWRYGLLHGQHVVFCPRSVMSFSTSGSEDVALDPVSALRLPNKESLGWRVGTVAGAYHSDLFLWMHDTQLMEPLSGRCEGELLQQYCFGVFGPPSTSNLNTLQDVLLDRTHASHGVVSKELEVPRPLPEIPHLQLFCVRTLNPTAIGDRASLSPRSLLQQKEQQFSKPCTALLDISSAACRSVMIILEEGGGAVRLGSVEHGARLRQQIRIEPVRISRQRWRSFASDHWCTVIGMCDGRLMACVDDDTRFLIPLEDEYTAELVDPKLSSMYTPAPKLPTVVAASFRCEKSLEEAVVSWQEILRQVAASDLADGKKAIGGGRSNAALKKIQSAQTWQQKKQSTASGGGGGDSESDASSAPYDSGNPTRPQCDDTIIRNTEISEAQTREARMLCQLLPESHLIEILQWVLELHGVHLRDGETLSTALRLFAAVRLATVVGNEHPVPEERYSCDLPTTAQWCLHQREKLVSAEIGNRDYAVSQEKMERETFMFDERLRYERLKSLFDEDEDDQDVEGGHRHHINQFHETNPLHALRPASAGMAHLSSRASSFASTGSRRLSRKPTNNLRQLFANKWRRSLDSSVLSSVVSAAYLPSTMRDRILTGGSTSQAALDKTADSSLAHSPAMGSPTSAYGSAGGGGRATSATLRTAESMTNTTIRLLEEGRRRTAVHHSDSDDDGEENEASDDGGAAAGTPRRITANIHSNNADAEQMRKRQLAAEGRAIGVLEQLSTFPSWPMRYTLHTGVQISFDISVQACDTFGLYHSQQYEVTRGDLAGEIVTILGVYRRQLWRYSTLAEAMPFDGATGAVIVAQHGLQLVSKQGGGGADRGKHNVATASPSTSSAGAASPMLLDASVESGNERKHVQQCDAFFFPVFPSGEYLRLDTSEAALFGTYGVLFGQRYLVTGKRSKQNFLPMAPPPPAAGSATTSMSSPSGSGGAALASSSVASADASLPPMIAILGVCKNQKLWVASVDAHGGSEGNGWARSYHRNSSSTRTIVEDWGLVFMYTAPVTIGKSMHDAMLLSVMGGSGKTPSLRSPHSTPGAGHLQPPPSSAVGGSSVVTSSPLVHSALYRERKHFRFRNSSGEVLLFDISPAALDIFGVRFGDRVLFRKPAKLCGRICVILGVREKKLWKVDERDTSATVLPKSKCAADLQSEYGIKVSGHQVIREFIG
ncbi:Hypothetical protein, putative [Bodo saltans]|uniref:Uncharacterized protein n=1 Tax=Bodo saltans TaxID=75058 RepID=A0A0S4J301_BODSA|nr:Hypothetical protein, putative [Bodo saltans]|eukprot:CUG85628.1 Hypothetical protein, putative [Bodo saltans]